MTRDTVAFDTLETVAVDAARTFQRLATDAMQRGNEDGERMYRRASTSLWKEVYRRRYGR